MPPTARNPAASCSRITGQPVATGSKAHTASITSITRHDALILVAREAARAILSDACRAQCARRAAHARTFGAQVAVEARLALLVVDAGLAARGVASEYPRAGFEFEELTGVRAAAVDAAEGLHASASLGRVVLKGQIVPTGLRASSGAHHLFAIDSEEPAPVVPLSGPGLLGRAAPRHRVHYVGPKRATQGHRHRPVVRPSPKRRFCACAKSAR